jgi:hypothetical protein
MSWLTQLGRVVNGEGHVFDHEIGRGEGLFFAQNKNPGGGQGDSFLKNKDSGTTMAAAERGATVVAMLVLRAAVLVGRG